MARAPECGPLAAAEEGMAEPLCPEALLVAAGSPAAASVEEAEHGGLLAAAAAGRARPGASRRGRVLGTAAALCVALAVALLAEQWARSRRAASADTGETTGLFLFGALAGAAEVMLTGAKAAKAIGGGYKDFNGLLNNSDMSKEISTLEAMLKVGVNKSIVLDPSWKKFLPNETQGMNESQMRAMLFPRLQRHDGNLCYDDEEEHAGLCYKRCELLTFGTHPFRTSAFSCCRSAPCDWDRTAFKMGICGGYSVSGDTANGMCPHTPGACFRGPGRPLRGGRPRGARGGVAMAGGAARLPALLAAGWAGARGVEQPAAARPAASACWTGDFTFQRCCLQRSAAQDCWQGAYTYERCCLAHPVLARADVDAALAGGGSWACGCAAGQAASSGAGGAWDWCGARRAAMLGWDLGPLYAQFLHLGQATLSACPVGALLFAVADAASKANQGVAPASSPALLWADELVTLLVAAAGPALLERWVDSGWNVFLMASHLRRRLRSAPPAGGEADEACAVDGGAEGAFLRQAAEMIQGGAAVPLPAAAAFLAALEGGSCPPPGAAQAGGAAGSAGHRGCCLPRALGFAALADASAVAGRVQESREFLGLASGALASAVGGGAQGAFVAMLRSKWPLVDAVDRLFQQPTIELKVADTIRGMLRKEPQGALASPGSFQMRIFPRREIVSNMIRFVRTPFCGMRPFLLLIERIAASASTAPGVLTFVEGGPHVGDCTLWAAAALESAGTTFFAAGYEPLPDASALFRDSVLANSWDGRVVVVPRALGASDGEKVTLAYFPGHNGEGTTVRAAADAHCGESCTGFSEIATVTLDSSWPALRAGRLDMLKLSVNGEELNVLRGARALLAKRQVCSALVHVTKAQRGYLDSAAAADAAESGLEGAGGAAGGDPGEPRGFAPELWNLLSVAGGLELLHHLDEDTTSQVASHDRRERPSTRRLRSAAELDAVFRAEASPHDYLVARQEHAGPGTPCEGSVVLHHWGAVFG